MTRYAGRIMLEVESPAAILERVVSDFEAAVKLAATDFPQVHEITVEPDLRRHVIYVRMVMEAGGSEELDDVADSLLGQALSTLNDESSPDDLTVVESALVPA